MTFRYPRQAPFRPRPRRSGRIAAWFSHFSMAIILISLGYFAIDVDEDQVEEITLSDGIYAGHPQIASATLLRFGDVPVWLKGIDAPDPNQTCLTASNIEWDCGSTAASVLADLISSGPITCDGQANATGDMIFAICRDNEGTNLNAWLVEFGWAVVKGNEETELGELEAIARREQRGIWATRFEMPWDWRQERESE